MTVTRSALRRGVGLATAAMLIAACQPAFTVHGDGLRATGPLSGGGGGGFAMTEPRKVEPPWFGSFGAFELCANKPGTRIVLKQVTWEAADDARPLSVTPWLRVVDRTTRATTSFISVAGLPWDPYGEVEPYPGKYTENIAGTVITQPCAELSGRAREFTELIFVIKTGKQGAELKGAAIDYEVDGSPYRLVIDQATMITCGAAIEGRDDEESWCPPDRHKRAGEN